MRYSIRVSMFSERSLKSFVAVFFIVSALFFSFPYTSFAAPSFLNQLEDLLILLITRSQNTIPSAPEISPPTPSSSNSLSGILGSQSFGGPILPPTPILCTTPPGAMYVLVGAPNPKPVICQPGACKIYEAQPPYRAGQYLLGNTAPSPVPIPCIVGITPVGSGFPIGNTPGVGAQKGGSSSSGSSEPAPASSCVQSQFAINNSLTKQVAENAVRDQLGRIGVGVNNEACGYGETFQQHRARTLRIFGEEQGCTDLSGLQCGTTDYLQSLASVCGADNVVITGGSEAGHETHNPGNAVDLKTSGTSLQSCLSSRSDIFENLGGGRYRDKRTGSTFTYESGEAHFHLCILGFGC